MRLAILITLISSVLLLGCEDNLEEREYYRFVIGKVYVDLMFTTLSLCETTVSKTAGGNATELDRQRLEDAIAALERHREDFARMLDEDYKRPELRVRDEAVLLFFDEIISASNALVLYLKTRDTAYLDSYFQGRDKFVALLEEMSGHNILRN